MLKLKRNIITILLLTSLVISISCASKNQTVSSAPNTTQNTANERIIWSTEANRPDWTVNEPAFEGNFMYFVGLSNKCATENTAREEARRNAITQVVQYLGVAVKDKFQQITSRYGLSSDISNPTVASRGFVDSLSAGLAKNVKVQKWYIEKWENKLGEIFFLAYGLATVPKNVINEAYNDAIDQEKDKLKDKIAKENNAKAKAQMEDALKAFEDMKKSGFSE